MSTSQANRIKKRNNFDCTHSHGEPYCRKYDKQCDRKCKDTGECFHCTHNHIPMSQHPCRNCTGLERTKNR